MSTLLDDIINLAIDGNQPLPDILRKCLLLGHELRNERLKQWANQELNGYKSGETVPEYRTIPAYARGHFIGPFQSQFQNHLIPSAALEEDHRRWAQSVSLLQSVSAYADIAKTAQSSPGQRMVIHWPPDMVGYYQDKLLENFICHKAWQEVPHSAVVEMLDTVRNRTLNMALGIKDELGTSYTDLHRIESTEVASKIQGIIFHNTGGNTNVAIGQSTVDASHQGQTVIKIGDRNALDTVLSRAGLGKEDLDELSEAMEIDGKKQPGSKINEWVKVNASKILTGGVKVGTKIGSEILTALIKQHYGI